MKSYSMKKTLPVRIMKADRQAQEITMHNYEITYDIWTHYEHTQDIDDARTEQEITFAKINTFLSEIIDQSIVLEKSEDLDAYAEFFSFANNFVVLPELNENVFLAALHCKLNAIAGENTEISELSLRDIQEDITHSYYLESDTYDELPAASEWQGEMPYWPGCWWNRPDVNTLDRNAQTQEEYDNWQDVKKTHGIDKINMETFREIELLFRGADKCDCAGDVIEVDFEKSDIKHGKYVWKPLLLD